jgi:malonate transporter and related proteins
MLNVLGIVAPIFIAIAIGYVLAKSEILPKESIRGLGIFVLYVALPALIIKALVRSPLSELINLRYLAAYGAGSVVVFGLGFALARFGQRRDLQSSALAALGMAASNSGFIGYPLAALVIGPPAILGLALCMLVENLLIIPAALAMAEAGTQVRASLGTTLKASAAGLIKNPIMMAIVAGTLLSVFGIGLPAPLLKTVDLFATASAPVALFAIGASLVGLQIRGLGGDAGQIVVGKLLVHPLLVYLGFKLVGPVDPALKATGIIMASMPMVSIYPLLGQKYGLGEICAAALMMSTIFSVLTITLIIWLVGP